MKFHIEIDCTPEELRQLVGLPDLAPLHDSYQSQVKDMMGKGITPDIVETLIKSWSPAGQNGFDLLRTILSPMADGKAGTTSGDKSPPTSKS